MVNDNPGEAWAGEDTDAELLDEDFTVDVDDFEDGDNLDMDLNDDPAAHAAFGDGISFDDAANAVASWASGAGTSDDPFVREFVNGLRNRTDLTFWASIDLEHEFPEPVAGRLTAAVARWLLRLRNVAVFMPVGLTWWAISRVSEDFVDFSADLRAQGGEVNFLEYWGSYPVEFFRIYDIALLGAAIIAGIILLTLVTLLLDSLVDQTRNRAFERRAQVILTVRRALHSAREATPESLATSLAESMTELVESSRLIIDAARRLEQASIGVGKLEPTFTSLNDRLVEFDSRLSGTIVGSVDRLNASVSALSSMMDGTLKALLAESVAGIDEVREQLHRTAASVEFGTQQLLQDLSAISGRTGRPSVPAIRPSETPSGLG